VIDEVEVTNFKRFSRLAVRLGRLSLLTGVNSGGKSSVIQALLLLHSDRLPGGAVPLNGPHGLALGEASDVLNSNAASSIIEISIGIGGDRGSLVLEVPHERSPSLSAVRIDLPAELARMTGRERGFVYLSAERLGPRDLQEVAVDFEDDLSVGTRGEFTAHVLTQLGREPVDLVRQHPDTAASGGIVTLNSQTELWMSSIVSPIQIEATWLAGTNAAMVRFRPPNLLTEWLRPANVGFGVSYALPIVVAGLTSPPEGLLVVENPEAHLHPAGQSAMGRFLARVAASGTQVLVETHSDHVIDGVRRAVGVDRTIPAEDVVAHFFSSDATPVALSVDEKGSMSGWPLGFFDQTERDLSELARVQRSG
jgi:predicted ATPase